MNGTNYLLDTNAAIALLGGNGHFEDKLLQSPWVGISVISVIEFLSFKNISGNDKKSFEVFFSRITVVSVSNDLIYLESISKFKAENNLKLPDAIIGYTAIENKATLISNDKHFKTSMV